MFDNYYQLKICESVAIISLLKNKNIILVSYKTNQTITDLNNAL